MIDVMIYKCDIPVGFPPGITSPREDCRSRAWPEGDNPLEAPLRIGYIIPNKYKTKKGGKLQTPDILDKYSSSALLN